jgi:hypothetical protein
MKPAMHNLALDCKELKVGLYLDFAELLDRKESGAKTGSAEGAPENRPQRDFVSACERALE